MTSCLSSEQIQELVLPLTRRFSSTESGDPIHEVITDILNCAQSFVPCEAGSLMLSHPEQPGALVFVASFGAGSERLPGTILPQGTGIAGQVFASGEALLTNAPKNDQNFYSEIDRLTEHRTSSLLCVPLKAHNESVGVLSLLNRQGGEFQEADLILLNVFCHHLNQSIQMILEERRQREAALRDHLSGLFNDRYLYSYLSIAVVEALESNLDLGLVFLDLDHFKAVVDREGHLVGSQALRGVGQIIGKVATEFGCVPARYGGDEYVVVIPKTTPVESLKIAETLRKQIEGAVLVCEGEGLGPPVTVQGEITASVGVACLSSIVVQNLTVEQIRQQLLRAADKAMYVAKAKGKNCVYQQPTVPV